MGADPVCPHGRCDRCPHCDLEAILATCLERGEDPIGLLVGELRRLGCDVVVRVGADWSSGRRGSA